MALPPRIYQRLVTSGSAASGSFSGSVEYGVQMSNSTIARRMGFALTDWNHLRVGIRYRLQSSNSVYISGSGNDPPGCYLQMGFCHNPNYALGAETLKCWAGMSWYGSPDWANDEYLQLQSTNTTVFHKGALASGYFFQGAYGYPTDMFTTTNSNSCDMIAFDLLRVTSSAVGFRGNLWRRTSRSVGKYHYYSHQSFLSHMTLETPTQTGYSYDNLHPNIPIVPLSESIAYPLDSVYVHLAGDEPYIEILDFAVAKIA